ncbi:MAG: hypothetical protein PHN35_04735 [Clostridia bacterium]|nr:hypothetical protein [Clostridia bacterium]MDD4799088.1 hypothetical protein [Clostridia bacterium]
MWLIILAFFSVIMMAGSVLIVYDIMKKEYLPLFRELQRAQKLAQSEDDGELFWLGK